MPSASLSPLSPLAPWDAKFEDVLRASLPGLEPTTPLDPGTPLGRHGLAPAEGAAVLARLEETYCVALPRGTVTVRATPESVWRTLHSAVEAVWSHLGQRTAPAGPPPGPREPIAVTDHI